MCDERLVSAFVAHQVSMASLQAHVRDLLVSEVATGEAPLNNRQQAQLVGPGNYPGWHAELLPTSLPTPPMYIWVPAPPIPSAGAYKLPDAWAQKHARAYTAYAQPMVSGSARFLEEHDKGAPAVCCPGVHCLLLTNRECCLQHLCQAQVRILAQQPTCSGCSSHMSAVRQALPPHQDATALQLAERIFLGQELTIWAKALVKQTFNVTYDQQIEVL